MDGKTKSFPRLGIKTRGRYGIKCKPVFSLYFGQRLNDMIEEMARAKSQSCEEWVREMIESKYECRTRKTEGE